MKSLFIYRDLLLSGYFAFAPPPSTLCAPQLQNTCHYIVNHYVKVWHVRLGGANNMRPLSRGGGGGTNENDPLFFSTQLCNEQSTSGYFGASQSDTGESYQSFFFDKYENIPI